MDSLEYIVITCPTCGRENNEHEAACIYCGTPFVDSAVKTRTFADTNESDDIIPKWGTARTTSRINLNVFHDGKEEILTFETKDMEQLVMGRVDPETKEVPQIDLSPFDAVDNGVSRRHAAITRKENTLQLVDLHAANGTFLNGQKLVPEQPRVLRDGDDIRLGRLVIRIAFERS